MSILILAALCVVIVVAAVTLAFLLISQRRSSTVPPEAPVVHPGPPPMNDLQSALENVTDRSGRPMSERLDAETVHVEDLRIPDDTGPLLRRALDHVAQPADESEPPAPGADDDAGS